MKGVDELAASYRDEAAERIAELEAALLELEEHPDDAGLIDRAFRALHTIKGSGAMFGFDEVAAFAHELEAVFDAVREGRVAVGHTLVGLALQGKDLVRALVDGAPVDPAARERLVQAYRALLGAASPAAPAPAPAAASAGSAGSAAPAAAAAPPGTRTYRIRFAPHRDLLSDGTNPLALLDELRALGPCEVVADTAAVPPLASLDPEACLLAWEVTLATDRGEDAIRDVFIFVDGRCDLRIAPLAEAMPVAAATPAPAPGAGDVPARPPPPGAAPPAAPASTIRVAAHKLDGLVDLVGELVIAQARLARTASRRDDPELLGISEDLERLTAELRDQTLDLRMVPIGTTFSRFRRVTRDLAAELGKEIELEAEGAETELDKTVIERLQDPLVHVLRNACDHGIEAPEVRRAAGKPARGTVRLSAFHAGATVHVEISDDGAGLDPEAIRTRAVERGLLAPGAVLRDAELFDLVFLPGFTTARAVSSISGRGVGMDVVKRSVEALRGTVRIASARGAGTTIRIELPLTLAIIEGLLVTAAGTGYVLPLSAVEECVELTRADVERAHGARLAEVRGELVPYLRLREAFALPGARPDIEQIAIVHAEGKRLGLVVDDVVGQHQTVIKSLGRMCRNVKGISGGTILGDGTVALIVDVASLVQQGAAQ